MGRLPWGLSSQEDEKENEKVEGEDVLDDDGGDDDDTAEGEG